MDLPDYFPTYLNETSSKLRIKHIFQDFGRHGNVNVLHQESGDCLPQIQHANVLERHDVCAEIPTVPLRNRPVPVTFPFRDLVNGDIHCRSTKRQQFIKILRHLSEILNGKRDHCVQWRRLFMAGKKAVDQLGVRSRALDRKVATIQSNLPLSMRILCDRYADLTQNVRDQNFNSQYSGGVLACVRSEEPGGHLLVHAEGSELNQLSVTEVEEFHPLLKWQDITHMQTDPVFQVDAKSVNDSVFVCTRHAESCIMQSFPSHSTHRGNGFTHLSKQCFMDTELPTAVSVSPFVPGECLIASAGGVVHIWSADSGLQKKVFQKKQRFSCEDPWCHVQYGCHPRQLIVTDRTTAEMFDHRSSFSKGVDLFALPSRHVQQKERIMAAHTHDKSSPYHVVATDHSLFLLDQRFPGTPVMQWYPDLKGPLHHLASADCSTDTSMMNSVVLVASQYLPEAMVYPFNHGSGHAVTMSASPWQISSIGDVCHLDLAAECTEHLVLRKRFVTSLSGLAVLPAANEGSFLTYQSDAYGEVYYQYYGRQEDSCLALDKTCSGTLGENKQVLPSKVKEHLRTWLSRLQEQVDDLRSRWMKNKYKAEPLTYVKCPPEILHSAGTSSSDVCVQCSSPIDLTRDSEAADSGMCLPCRSGLKITRDETADGENTVHHLEPEATYLNSCAQPLEEYHCDSVHTQVYLSLAGIPVAESFVDLCKQREAERTEMKQTRRAKQRAARERRNKRRGAEESDINTTDGPGTQPGQEKDIIETMMADLLRPPKVPKTVSYDDVSMSSMTSPRSGAESSMSDQENQSDTASSVGRTESLTSPSAKEGTGLSGFGSLLDDEDFFGSQEMDSLFSFLRSTSQTPVTDAGQQTPKRNVGTTMQQSQPGTLSSESPLTKFQHPSPAGQRQQASSSLNVSGSATPRTPTSVRTPGFASPHTPKVRRSYVSGF